jgi:TatD DNase family protein
MGKQKSRSQPPSEEYLLLPPYPASNGVPIVDTHTHLASTFAFYKQKYPNGQYQTIHDFVKALYTPSHGRVEAIVDVWCEAPVDKMWRELADSAIKEEDRKEKWGGVEYWFAMGVHPHEAKHYTDEVEREM